MTERRNPLIPTVNETGDHTHESPKITPQTLKRKTLPQISNKTVLISGDAHGKISTRERERERERERAKQNSGGFLWLGFSFFKH